MKNALLEMLNAAKANMKSYEESGDENAIRAGKLMIAEFEKAIAELEE
jgi:hypothetical protein